MLGTGVGAKVLGGYVLWTPPPQKQQASPVVYCPFWSVVLLLQWSPSLSSERAVQEVFSSVSRNHVSPPPPSPSPSEKVRSVQSKGECVAGAVVSGGRVLCPPPQWQHADEMLRSRIPSNSVSHVPLAASTVHWVDESPSSDQAVPSSNVTSTQISGTNVGGDTVDGVPDGVGTPVGDAVGTSVCGAVVGLCVSGACVALPPPQKQQASAMVYSSSGSCRPHLQ